MTTAKVDANRKYFAERSLLGGPGPRQQDPGARGHTRHFDRGRPDPLQRVPQLLRSHGEAHVFPGRGRQRLENEPGAAADRWCDFGGARREHGSGGPRRFAAEGRARDTGAHVSGVSDDSREGKR